MTRNRKNKHGGGKPATANDRPAVTVDDVRALDLVLADKAQPLVVYLAAFRDEATKRALVAALARAVGAGAVVSGVVKANVLSAAWMPVTLSFDVARIHPHPLCMRLLSSVGRALAF